MTKCVLVLDGRQRSSLAMTRSFGRRGLPVRVADSASPSLAGRSRYALSQHVYPDPTVSPQAFIDWVNGASQALGISVVVPTTDTTTMLLAPVREKLEGVTVLCAQAATYELVSDKGQVLQLAKLAGIKVPRSVLATSEAEIDAHLLECPFPVVIKPARSKVVVDGTIVTTSVVIAYSRAEALRTLHKQPWLGHVRCLIQEYISGHGAGVFTLFSDDRAVAWFSHERIREKPPTGGVSVLSTSAALPVAVMEAANKLLSAANWNGLAMLEFKIASDGTPYLMEINARPWGSLQLAVDCGVDFPWLLYQSATGARIDPAPGYATGRRLRWLLGDVDNLLLQWREAGLSTRRKMQATGAFLGTFGDVRCRQEIFRWSDPRPALHELNSWFRALL